MARPKVCLVLSILLVAVTASSAVPPPCPYFEPDDSAWVLDKIEGSFLVSRTFYHVEDLAERVKGNRSSPCKGILLSALINNREEQIIKEVHSPSGVSYFLNNGREEWKEGVKVLVLPDKRDKPTVLIYV